MLLFLGFNGDTAKGASSVDVDGVFAFCRDVFSFVACAAENEAGFYFDLNVFGNSDFDTTKCAEGFDNGVFFEFGVSKI